MATKKDEYSQEAYQNAVARATNANQTGTNTIQTNTAGLASSDTYEGQMADLYNQIQNRPDFSYDVNADPLYQQYKDQYIQGGKLAMRDTMGKAAALTGGYASTYAQQVGQQTFDSYLQNLTAQIPELYSTAYNRYADQGNQLLQQYNMLGTMRDTAYSKEQDAWNKQQQLWSNLYTAIGQTGYKPTDAELAAAGMTRAQANALKAMWDKANPAAATGGGGSYTGSSPKGKTPSAITQADIDRWIAEGVSMRNINDMINQSVTAKAEGNNNAPYQTGAQAARDLMDYNQKKNTNKKAGRD